MGGSINQAALSILHLTRKWMRQARALMGSKKLPGIAVEDIGKCAFGIFRRPDLIGKAVGVAGEDLTGAETAAALSRALEQPVAFNAVSPDVYRGFGFPGADDLGDMSPPLPRTFTKVSFCSSSYASRSSSCVFITMGPYHAMGSLMGFPEISKKRTGSSPAWMVTLSPSSNRTMWPSPSRALRSMSK